MATKIVLVDINPKMIRAWRATFEENPEVEIIQGSMLEQKVDAWVTPTNARASMDGGLDAAIKNHLGQAIEKRIQLEIHRLYEGLLAVGHATCVPTGSTRPGYLISTPTMTGSSENISHTLNVALACAAAFQAVHMQNAREPDSIQSVALPGLGANTGQVPTEICADLMWTGYNLFRRRAFDDFAAMRAALEAELGDLGPSSPIGKKKAPTAAPKPVAPTPGVAQPSTPAAPSDKKADVDFDDF
jgi:O-acetyl-ADP-ribose deacetylase (regulator of RNase III)